MSGAGAADAAWPARFRAALGRAPRVLHIGNIANYAYVNAKLMRRHGVDAVVLDPDFYHFASAPEWLEAEIAGDIGDHFHPRWRDARLGGFARPEWFLNGPTPFVFPELAAREAGQRWRRALFARASAIYRHGIGARAGQVAPLRRLLDGTDPFSIALKSAVRGATRALRAGGTAQPAAPLPAMPAAPTLPRSVPEAVLRAALAPFDVIIGYTLGARLPAALGLPRFVSLELGTLRGLPFEDSELGRLCAWVYRNSPEVFVTNLDCLEPARRLGIPPERITPVLHPFELDAALRFAAAPPPSPLAGEVPYFLCPARHHWKGGNASWLKGNDVLIRGAALAARRGAAFRLVMVEWGEEVALSRALIAECGLERRVRWIAPAHRRALWPMLAGAAGVLDQFAASAYGGVGLEAMALGRPVVSRIEGADLSPFHRRPPPILHAATPEEVAARIAEVLADPAGARGRAGQDWMIEEHGVARQLALQFAACERLVARFGAAS